MEHHVGLSEQPLVNGRDASEGEELVIAVVGGERDQKQQGACEQG